MIAADDPLPVCMTFGITVESRRYATRSLWELAGLSELHESWFIKNNHLKTNEEIFDNTNLEAVRYDVLSSSKKLLHAQWEEELKGQDKFSYEEVKCYLFLLENIHSCNAPKIDIYDLDWYIFTGRATVEFCRKLLNTDPRIIAAILAQPTSTNEIINLVAETIGYNRTTNQSETSASTPEAFKINSDLAPDFDAAFDDEPQSRRLIIKSRPATTGRKLPMPKSRRQVYDFSKYGISFFDGMARDEATVYHYSCWNGYYSLKELHLITKALKKIKE